MSVHTHMLPPYTSHLPHACPLKAFMLLNLHMSLHLHMLLNSNTLLYFHMSLTSRERNTHNELPHDAEVACGECYACKCASFLTYVSLVACVSLVFLIVSLLALVACISLVSSLSLVTCVASSTSNLCLMWGDATHFTRIRKGAKLTHATPFSKEEINHWLVRNMFFL